MNPTTLEGPGAVDTPGQRFVAHVLRRVLHVTLGATFRTDLPVGRQRSRLLKVTRLTRPPRAAEFRTGHCGGVPGE